jgi:rhodanese-related sulfurtransferase
LKIIRTRRPVYDSTMAREIDVAELEAADDVQLVDVRTPEEREAGRISTDTAHVPFEQLGVRAAEFAKDRLLVFYCRSGDRSAVAAEAFEASGFAAASLAGGIVAWEESGRPVEGEIGSPSGLPPR